METAYTYRYTSYTCSVLWLQKNEIECDICLHLPKTNLTPERNHASFKVNYNRFIPVSTLVILSFRVNFKRKSGFQNINGYGLNFERHGELLSLECNIQISKRLSAS